jgi:hypothetical protein
MDLGSPGKFYMDGHPEFCGVQDLKGISFQAITAAIIAKEPFKYGLSAENHN